MNSLFMNSITLYIMKLKLPDPSLVDQPHSYGNGKHFFTVKGTYKVLI